MSGLPPVSEQLELLQRGAVDLVDLAQLTDKLERSRASGKPLTVKTGFDPSSPDLHLGHTVLLRKMRHFQLLGHRVIFLIGDFTAMIGDPSGRNATRPQLSRDQIEHNMETYARQVFKVLDRETTVVDYNSRWLDELGTAGLVRLAGRYTLARMMEREDFRTRYEANQPISMHELIYPLVQAYDSIALEADVELGGHDQIFNLLVGRHLMREHGLEPQVVLTVPLLVGTDGAQKMSKSLGNAVAIEDPPGEMYGRIMSIPDSTMWEWLPLVTDWTPQSIAERRRAIEAGELNPKAVKQELARDQVTCYRDATAADDAEREFGAVFSRGGLPDEIPEVSLDGPGPLFKLLCRAELSGSNKEAQRLVRQGAVEVDRQRATDPFLELSSRADPYLVKVGKRRFAHLRIGDD